MPFRWDAGVTDAATGWEGAAGRTVRAHGDGLANKLVCGPGRAPQATVYKSVGATQPTTGQDNG